MRPKPALLAGALINPRGYGPADPAATVAPRRQQMILRRMGTRDAPVPRVDRARIARRALPALAAVAQLPSKPAAERNTPQPAVR